MSNPIQPAVKVTIAGADYLLRFDFEAIAKAEELTDTPLLTGMRPRDLNTPKINFVRAMLLASLLPQMPSITRDDVKLLVDRKNLPEVWAKVMEAWMQGMAEPEPDAAATENPLTGQS